MKVTLTVEAGDGRLSYVEAEAATYETAKAQAEAQLPEGSKPSSSAPRSREASTSGGLDIASNKGMTSLHLLDAGHGIGGLGHNP